MANDFENEDGEERTDERVSIELINLAKELEENAERRENRKLGRDRRE